MDIFANMLFIYHFPFKTAESVLIIYCFWLFLFGKPDKMVCDNGGEFENIPKILKLRSPANNTQANLVLKRFQR